MSSNLHQRNLIVSILGTRSAPGNRFVFIFVLLLYSALCGWSESLWDHGQTEEIREVEPGLVYERLLFTMSDSAPARAHILSVTGIGTNYRLDIIGSFGALIPPTVFSKQAEAIAAINGSFFNQERREGIGLIQFNRRLIYPPSSTPKYRATVGCVTDGILIDWLEPEDIDGKRIKTDKSGWDRCYAAISGGPVLIRHGVNVLPANDQDFNMTEKHPRTAIGQKATGEVLWVVVDGRQAEWSEGISLLELAELLLVRGAVDALNLDGGGSSIMIVNHEIVNHPSDYAQFGQPGHERPIANVIALFRK